MQYSTALLTCSLRPSRLHHDVQRYVRLKAAQASVEQQHFGSLTLEFCLLPFFSLPKAIFFVVFWTLSIAPADGVGRCDDEDKCGRFSFSRKYNVCNNGVDECKYFVGSATCGVCEETVFENPFEEVQWTDYCDTEYDFYSTIYFCENGDTFGYNLNPGEACGSLAPIIRMQAGKSYQMRLVNEGSEITNLHTHGLHIPGSGNTDDVTRAANPGECLFYNWTLPEDHMDGTFWYHAHAHEHTYDQVNGGAMGMLLIDPADSASARPDWVEAEENDRFLLIATSYVGGGPDATFTDYANSEEQHELIINLNTWHRLRIALADPEAQVSFTTRRLQKYCVLHSETEHPSAFFD